VSGCGKSNTAGRAWLEDEADRPAGGNDQVVVNTSRVRLHPEKRKEFLQTMGQLLEPIAATKGCVAFRCYVDATDENSSLLIGEWETESALNSYLRSDGFAILRGAITVLSVQSSDFTCADQPCTEWHFFTDWGKVLNVRQGSAKSGTQPSIACNEAEH